MGGVREAPQDEADVLDEAQIEHAVRFVQDGDLDVTQIEDTLLEIVDDATGRADQDVDPLFQNPPLLLVVDAAEHDGELETRKFGDAFGVRMNLHGELARRRDHDGARRVERPVRRPAVRQQAIEQGDEERRRFARAGLSLPGHVVARERQGQGLRLDRRAARIA